MRSSQPAQRLNLPVSVTFVNGKTHIRMEIANTRLEDWVDKQDVLTLLRITDRTLRTLRNSKKIPWAQLGGKIYYYLPGILYILEQGVAQ